MKCNKGFTLIEVIVSIALIGIISVSTLSIFNTGITNIVRAGVRTEGVDLAESDFLNESEVVGEPINIKINLPTTIGNSEHNILGSIRKGNILLNYGSSTQVEVEIEAFVPN